MFQMRYKRQAGTVANSSCSRVLLEKQAEFILPSLLGPSGWVKKIPSEFNNQ